MSTLPNPRPATYQDLLDLPSNQVGQILNGTLYAMPRPASRHARSTSRLGGALSGPFDVGRGGPGGWLLLDEPELHLRDDVVVPDLAGWRRERMPELPEAAFFVLPPDWVCEVLSPSTAGIDRVVKMEIYRREEVKHVWLIDPLEQTLEVFALHNQRWVTMGAWRENAVVRAEPFDAIELELELLWAR